VREAGSRGTPKGQVLDALNGLLYYGARYYDAAPGRFISVDTIVPCAGSPQSLNRYSYTYNNPMRYYDSDGQCIPFCELLIWEKIRSMSREDIAMFARYVADQHVPLISD
jgi:RHS repeat-associated protein